ncbi:MAG: MlaD family protein [Humidesulfovibrio sp.]|uniref:MlaD family protein n=1 Tax=Humidesulfovibrio sp. TaxID=2910988 RepID=UPI002735E30B|nr:MlaD family protein [Humidesulfovibrio sp.]MDP2848774.1 MlaD family protein [Humidesulfovibrio sp.]
MIRGSDYFKLGLFVIGGVVLLFVVLFALGAGKFFQRTYQMETYINESVNGLEVGSAVKFRGVRVGSVSEISFVAGKYGQKAAGYRYVYVLCTLDKDIFGTMGDKSSREQAVEEVSHGLRARTISQGLTGQLFLGLDYVDPDRNPPLPIEWEPVRIYVPSASSTLSKVEQAVLDISNTLSGMDKAELPEAVKSFRRFADSASTFLDNTNPKEMGAKLSATLDQTRTLIARINVLLADPAAETLVPEAAKTLAGMRKVVEGAGPDTVQLVRESKEMVASLKVSAKALEAFLANPETARQLAEMPGAMQQARETVGELKSAAKRLNSVLGRVEQLTAAQQANVEGILDSARGLVDNLRELTGEAKRYPAGMLFGPAPDKSPLGGQ